MKRSYSRALRAPIAVAVLATSIVGVTAIPAKAATSSAPGNFDGSGDPNGFINGSGTVYLSPGGAANTTTWGSVYPRRGSLNCYDSGAYGHGSFDYQYLAGETIEMCLLAGEVDSGAADANFTNLKFTFRVVDGSPIGSASVNLTKANAGGTHSSGGVDTWYTSPFSVTLDDDPLNGSVGTPRVGESEMFLELSVDQTSGTDYVGDSRGGFTPNPGGNQSLLYGRGLFETNPYQYLNGMYAADATELNAAEDDQGPSSAHKDFSMVRVFEDTWTAPGSSLDTYANEGKVVVWSAKPKNATTDWNCDQNATAGFDACPNVSPYYQSTVDTTTLNAMAVDLQDAVDDSTFNVPFIAWAINHEPHDNAIVAGNGWEEDKCGAPSSSPGNGDPGEDASDDANDANSDGSEKPCFGTDAEFKALYAAMHYAQQHACGGVCANVKVIYIGVGSNMVEDGPGATSGNEIGEGDLMAPDPADYDMLGADNYNYSCFDNAMPTSKANGVITGTNSLTSSSFGFVAGDVGKRVEGAGIPAGTTITARNSSTNVTLSGTSTNASGVRFGVFRTPCIQSDWKSADQTFDDDSGTASFSGKEKNVIGLAQTLNKKLIIAETGSHPGCYNSTDYGLNEGCYGSDTDDTPGGVDTGVFDRAQWFTDMYNWMATDAEPQAWLLGVIYFHSSGEDLSKSNHDWRFLDATAHTSDPAYIKSGSVGRAAWQSTIGSDTLFVANAADFTRTL